MQRRTHKNERRIFVVLPGHNEEDRLAEVLEDVLRRYDNVIFVDDGSTDRTYEIAAASGAITLSHITNLGKGAALRTGCDFALSKGADVIVVMDSDGQHDPAEIPKFLKALDGGSDIVVGCRKWNSDMPFVMKLGNYGLHKISSMMFKVDVSDTQSGFRAFTAESYPRIRWESNDYSMESEMLARIHSEGLKVSTVGIRTIYHDTYKGTTVMNGLRIATNMIIWKMLGMRENASDGPLYYSSERML